ncbi:MAG: GDYXXLXY domain-containing protein, partial [Sandaracinobacteroides sp.]
MKRWFLLAALLLPALWLGGGIVAQERALGRSGEWRIPIEGYDPRDPLRGQYVQFSYGWDFAGDRTLCASPVGCHLCLSESGGRVTATATYPGASCRSKVDP